MLDLAVKIRATLVVSKPGQQLSYLHVNSLCLGIGLNLEHADLSKRAKVGCSQASRETDHDRPNLNLVLMVPP